MRRKFEISATNAALYDAYNSDPLYKHLPFLLLVPDPVHRDTSSRAPNPQDPPPFVKGIFTSGSADATWNLGCHHNDPTGGGKVFTVHSAPLDLFLSWGSSGQEVKRAWKDNILREDIAGPKRLVGRTWYGYLGSTMGQAESDNPPAQELLSKFPEKCKEMGIPVSAMFLSSGYTVDPKTGFLMTFNWNYTRYPDFEGLMRLFHSYGIKISANAKPYVSNFHQSFEDLRVKKALFHDPITGQHSQTQVWSGLWAENSYGCWVDMTSQEGREYWRNGVKDLVRRGVDSLWNDDNEYTIPDDSHTCRFDLPHGFTNPGSSSLKGGQQLAGRVGHLTHCELMGQVSAQTLEETQPGRRSFVLTRSANVGTLGWANSSWSGDNFTSWKNFRGEVAMGLNAGLAFLHSYGDDVGGFAGPLPTQELFLRWVQSAVWRSRFCIHSFKPTPDARNGTSEVNEPWMYPEVLPYIRAAILRRYELIPYMYALSWEGALEGKAPMTWLGWDMFEKDPACYDEQVLEGQDFWVGTGRILVAGVYHPGVKERSVYLPSSASSTVPDEGYFDYHAGNFYAAGQYITVPTPDDHIATFVRAGTIIPIGKPAATVTTKDGLSSTTADGTKIKLVGDGGVVELDDWRGIEIYPPPSTSQAKASKWSWEWTEDDGESLVDANLPITKVKVEYELLGDEVKVTANWAKKDFVPLWDELWVGLPKTDLRKVSGAIEKEVRGRKGFIISIQ
ncbi:glycosyl hydrolases family 31-domain-containing protein [Flagelloscypha sp. PMI_526]|nr:glycosyl hydrolases family 31-domain-containing protein [Flagelloscypha sp. PMI_526]